MAAILEYRLAPGLPKAQALGSLADGPQTVNVHIHREDEGGYIEGAFLDRLPVSESSLANLANLVISGQSLTTARMVGSGISRTNWEILRDRLVSSGLLSWRGGGREHGVEPTNRGMRVFEKLADTTTPTPHPRE
jgi:hypothetical protein